MIDVITFAFIVLIWFELYRIRKTLEKLAEKEAEEK